MGEGYKAPSVSELYMDYTHMGVLTLGNPDLKPEESKNWDISYEGEWGKTFGKLTYFHNDIENMISTHTVAAAAAVGASTTTSTARPRLTRRTDLRPQTVRPLGYEVDQQLDVGQQ